MDAKQQRIAIAEACGWTVGHYSDNGVDYTVGYGPNGKMAGAVPGHHGIHHLFRLPDYLGDLNVMHDAEKMLTPELRYKYCLWLGPLTDERAFSVITATAAERAEAFLRAIGKWQEDSQLSEHVDSGEHPEDRWIKGEGAK